MDIYRWMSLLSNSIIPWGWFVHNWALSTLAFILSLDWTSHLGIFLFKTILWAIFIQEWMYWLVALCRAAESSTTRLSSPWSSSSSFSEVVWLQAWITVVRACTRGKRRRRQSAQLNKWEGNDDDEEEEKEDDVLNEVSEWAVREGGATGGPRGGEGGHTATGAAKERERTTRLALNQLVFFPFSYLSPLSFVDLISGATSFEDQSR